MVSFTLAGKIYDILQKYENKQDRIEKLESLFNEYDHSSMAYIVADLTAKLAELPAPELMFQFVVKVQAPSYAANIMSVNIKKFRKESEFIILVKRLYEILHEDMRDFDIYRHTGINNHYPTAVKHLNERWGLISQYSEICRSDMALKGEAYYGVRLTKDQSIWKKGPATFEYTYTDRPHTSSWLRPLIVM